MQKPARVGLDEGKQATGFLLHLDGWEWNPSTRIHGDA